MKRKRISHLFLLSLAELTAIFIGILDLPRYILLRDAFAITDNVFNRDIFYSSVFSRVFECYLDHRLSVCERQSVIVIYREVFADNVGNLVWIFGDRISRMGIIFALTTAEAAVEEVYKEWNRHFVLSVIYSIVIFLKLYLLYLFSVVKATRFLW